MTYGNRVTAPAGYAPNNAFRKGSEDIKFLLTDDNKYPINKSEYHPDDQIKNRSTWNVPTDANKIN